MCSYNVLPTLMLCLCLSVSELLSCVATKTKPNSLSPWFKAICPFSHSPIADWLSLCYNLGVLETALQKHKTKVMAHLNGMRAWSDEFEVLNEHEEHACVAEGGIVLLYCDGGLSEQGLLRDYSGTTQGFAGLWDAKPTAWPIHS